MAGGGVSLSRAVQGTRRIARNEGDRRRSQGSARLGRRLRSVLLAPHEGFAGALADMRRRNGAGLTPYVLSLLGGASLALLWLKVGALLGLREVCNPPLIGVYLLLTGLLGGVLTLVAQGLWGALGPRAAIALRSEETTAGESRAVWGLALLPLVVAFVVLIPLDLLIVGTETFTTDRLADPLATAWAAFSIAAAFSAAIWSLYLLTRGFQAQTKLSSAKAALGAAAACVCLAFVVTAFVLAVSFAPEGAGCPT